MERGILLLRIYSYDGLTPDEALESEAMKGERCQKVHPVMQHKLEHPEAEYPST
jgi:hypothetical protein